MRRGWPPHPIRLVTGICLTAIGMLSWFPLNVVFLAGALHLLWEASSCVALATFWRMRL